MKNILADYEEASDQLMNYHKSEAFFSRNSSASGKYFILNLLGFREGLPNGNKYLGLSSLICRNKKVAFKFVKDMLWRKINSW